MYVLKKNKRKQEVYKGTDRYTDDRLNAIRLAQLCFSKDKQCIYNYHCDIETCNI